jgi:hypothetical protein
MVNLMRCDGKGATNMKKIPMAGMCVIALGLRAAYTDVLPPNSHLLETCIKIVNCDSFPQCTFIQATYEWLRNDNFYNLRVISADQCLFQHTWYLISEFYWVNASEYDSAAIVALLNSRREAMGKRGIESIEIHVLVDSLPTTARYIDDTNHLSSQILNYRVIQSGDSLKMYSASRVSEYDNETPMKVEDFPVPEFPVKAYFRQESSFPAAGSLLLTRGAIVGKTAEAGNTSLSIIDCYGKEVSKNLQRLPAGGSFRLPVFGLPPGLYVVRFGTRSATVTGRLGVLQ